MWLRRVMPLRAFGELPHARHVQPRLRGEEQSEHERRTDRKRVQENGGAPQNDAWYQNVINGGKSVTVAIPKPVPVRIGA